MDEVSWLTGLTGVQLRQLVEELTCGRLKLKGATPTLLRNLNLPAEWSGYLSNLAEGGWQEGPLQQAVTWILAERESAGKKRVRLVTTRPGGTRGRSIDTPVVLRRLFQQAEREVLLAGFRVTERSILEHLRRPAGQELKVRLYVDLNPSVDVYGRKNPHPPDDLEVYPMVWWNDFLEKIWPEDLPPPRGWYSPLTLHPGTDGLWRSMHVKTAVVDGTRWLVTSANFTDRGQFRNLELGALVEDKDACTRVKAHFDLLVAQEVFMSFPGHAG